MPSQERIVTGKDIAMAIDNLYHVNSGVIYNQMRADQMRGQIASDDKNTDAFGGYLDSAIKSINQTNAYISDAENEEVRLALGETESTHDLTIALQKASTALQYTVAVRDKFLESYRTIMNMQI
ncbi:MAG: flagellar hook-basal body complex protein FliE [Lachnospiraceae bacterium]|nr:flagellar hook-basal body complex protein FliE [Lachnospiraceae bacterium]